MSLPHLWVDKIFMKLTVVYGRDFIGRWEGINLADVKADWAHELAGFEQHPESIAYALQNLVPGKPPTVLEFRALARKAPLPEHKALPGPVVTDDRLCEHLKRIVELKARAKDAPDSKDWARSILGRYDAGVNVRPVALRFAREAMGVM
jgi:hypothetical protein